MTKSKKIPPLYELLTPKQGRYLAEIIYDALGKTGNFDVTLQYRKMMLKYVKVKTSAPAPKGHPERKDQEGEHGKG